MELQWLLIAQAIKMHPDGLLDIAGIFRRAIVSRQRLAPSMAIVAKVRFDLTLASERTSFVLRLANVDGDWMEEMELPFTYPTLEQWTLGYSPIIHCAISDFEFPDIGEYAVEMYHGGSLIGGETFILARE